MDKVSGVMSRDKQVLKLLVQVVSTVHALQHIHDARSTMAGAFRFKLIARLYALHNPQEACTVANALVNSPAVT